MTRRELALSTHSPTITLAVMTSLPSGPTVTVELVIERSKVSGDRGTSRLDEDAYLFVKPFYRTLSEPRGVSSCRTSWSEVRTTRESTKGLKCLTCYCVSTGLWDERKQNRRV